MAQNYTRQSSMAYGDTITAALFNNEYNQLVNAFAYSSSSASSTGHRHDGSTGQGGNVPQIGDLDFLNKTIKTNKNSLQYLQNEFTKLGVIFLPTAANFITTIWKSEDEAKNIVNKLYGLSSNHNF